MDEKILLTNIQRFSLHDGPGIRTTVFLKGCSLRCPWCANPENLEYRVQDYIKDGISGTYGKWRTCDEIFIEVIKDAGYYGVYGENKFPAAGNNCLITSNATISVSEFNSLPGGVTFSGGEALMQADRLVPLFRKLRKSNIHSVVETCLFVQESMLHIAIEYIDLFYIDIKILEEDTCKKILKGDFAQYLKNLELLFAAGAHVVFRVPVIGEVTDTEENRRKVTKLIKYYSPIKVELIKEHNLGVSKYQSLGMNVPGYKEVSDELLEQYKEEIEKTGIVAEVCRI